MSEYFVQVNNESGDKNESFDSLDEATEMARYWLDDTDSFGCDIDIYERDSTGALKLLKTFK